MNCDSTPPSKTVPVRKLILLDGIMAEQLVVVLKDDGCNTNVLSAEFVERNRDHLDIHQKRSVISHSDKNRTETSEEIVLNTIVELGLHKCTSN